jgi:sterol desaturase/sphingolipid hydroxylase (fatty acid hydroxylase superfamily)
MSLPDLSFLLELPANLLRLVARGLAEIFLSPARFSLASLLSALCIALLFLGLAHRRRVRPLRLKVLARAVFPRRLRSPSSRVDVGYFAFNGFLFAVLFGWMVLSYHVVNNATNELLTFTLGTVRPSALSEPLAVAVMTAVLFVAYELGYWIDHYLSHNVAFLWEFHKVHHTAEVLSPLTDFRVHPVDTIVFHNILALVMGTFGGVACHLLGRPVEPLTIANTNALVLLFFFFIGHLQHTHFWIAFTGVWGRIVLSPAHHQIHHSTNPAHFNKNLGSCLAIWDWLFGTLHVPARSREKLRFGIEPKAPNVHNLTEGLLGPLVRTLARLRPSTQAGAAPEPDATTPRRA